MERTKTTDKKYRLVGYDTFSDEWYSLPGAYKTEAEAELAAQVKLEEIEREQPSSSSGGQAGIQDQVHVKCPNGALLRILPRDIRSLKR